MCRVAALAALLLVVTGCSGGDDQSDAPPPAASTPAATSGDTGSETPPPSAAGEGSGADVESEAGTVRYQGPGYTFDYPADWTDEGSPGDRDVRILGPAEAEELPPAITSVATGDFPAQVDMEQYADAYNQLQNVQLRDREVEGTEAVAIGGASDAVVVESTYSTTFEGTDGTVHELTVLALTGATGEKVAFRLGSDARTFSELRPTLNSIIDSIQLSAGART